VVSTRNEPYATPKPFGVFIKVLSTVIPVAKPSILMVNGPSPVVNAYPVALKYTLVPATVG
jgi:hypothetical protein